MIRPMLVTSGPLRLDNDRYAFEVKWDDVPQAFTSHDAGVFPPRPKGVSR